VICIFLFVSEFIKNEEKKKRQLVETVGLKKIKLDRVYWSIEADIVLAHIASVDPEQTLQRHSSLFNTAG